MTYKHIVEVAFSLGLFINAILFIPQILRLYTKKEARDVSLTTFVGFWFIQLSTVLHGILWNDTLLIYGTLLSMVTCGIVAYLIIHYRVKNKTT